MQINGIFITINIIDDLKNIILVYLTESHKNILEINNYDFKIEEIISKDGNLMNYVLGDFDSEDTYYVFSLCSRYGKLRNMKLLDKKNFPINDAFHQAIKNGNLMNIKWLIDNGYNDLIIDDICGVNLKTIEWLIKNNFKFSNRAYLSAVI
jgi:hypothetical protein